MYGPAPVLSHFLKPRLDYWASQQGFVCQSAELNVDDTVLLAVAAAAVQASLYDVPGGFRAIMFDRFSGVKYQVSGLVRSPYLSIEAAY